MGGLSETGAAAIFSEGTEAVVQRFSVKKVFLEISQNSQKNTCTRVSFLIKLQASGQLIAQSKNFIISHIRDNKATAS